ncbi:MAG: hypothetical protein AAB773_01315, partial [Patescibacteria group bacterium]
MRSFFPGYDLPLKLAVSRYGSFSAAASRTGKNALITPFILRWVLVTPDRFPMSTRAEELISS